MESKVKCTSKVVTTLSCHHGFINVTVKLVDTKIVEAEVSNTGQGYGEAHEEWLRDVHTAIGSILKEVARIKEEG